MQKLEDRMSSFFIKLLAILRHITYTLWVFIIYDTWSKELISIIENYAGYGQDLVFIISAFLIAVVFSLSIHEYAHAKVAFNNGDDTAKLMGRLSINPLRHFDMLGGICLLLFGFGWAKPVPVNPIKFKEYRKGIFLVSIAGVLTNFIISFFSVGFCCLFYYFISICEIEFLYYICFFLYFLFSFLATINLSLCLFNLLPIYPLDGFNIINSFSKGGNKFIDFMLKYGNIILIALFLTTLLGRIIGFAVNGILTPVYSFWQTIFGV